MFLVLSELDPEVLALIRFELASHVYSGPKAGGHITQEAAPKYQATRHPKAPCLEISFEHITTRALILLTRQQTRTCSFIVVP